VGDAPADELRAFVLEAGRALSLAGAAVSETQERLTRIATAAGATDAHVVVLPTALDGGSPPIVESVPQLTGALRLDQRPRHGRVVTVLGHVIMTVGLCLLLRPTPRDIVLAAGLGALVGGLRLLTAGHRTTTVLVPVLAAIIVSALTFTAVEHGFADPGLRTLIAPLVTFLPGGVLTTATIELASGEMVAGASRLVFGALQLILLTTGIVIGAALVGLPEAEVLRDNPGNLLGWWARCPGSWSSSSRPGSANWPATTSSARAATASSAHSR
jgi:uncharacterized membrane protein YjjP (DUF1212 family)